MKSCKATITIGINEGYNHNNETNLDFNEYLQNFLKDNCQSIGNYIPFVAIPSKTIYSESWGCPEGGEDTYTLTATANPKFVPSIGTWKMQVIEYVKRLKAELKQSTVLIEFSDVDTVYITDKGIDW